MSGGLRAHRPERNERPMSINKKAKKGFIIASISLVLAVGIVLGLWFFIQYQSDKKTVNVLPMMYVSTTYWGDQMTSSGTARSDTLQEIYPSSEQTVSEIYVQEGQQVSIGDPLIQYDKTRLELDMEGKDIAVKQAEIAVDDAEDELKKLQNTTPVSTPKPQDPEDPQDPVGPVVTPAPEPTPTPSPTVPPADVTLYSRLDADSKPYQGSGSSEDPYVFLVTEDCVLSQGFLQRLLGDGSGATPSPDDTLTSPFAAILEVREGNSNYGDLLYSILLDGNDLSGSLQVSDLITGDNTLESIAEVFEARSKATPAPTPSNNYNDMGYTKDELKKLIKEKRQEIKNLQLQVKQAELDLEKAKLALENSTVRSTIDGVVRTLIDVDSAAASSSPFLVVSGQGQYTITGSISESLLTSVHVGDMVTAMSYENGMSYNATISEISQYPLDSNSGMYYGTGNPNSSQYEFTAVVENPEGLTNGMYLDITLNVTGSADTDALYLDNAYIREDEGGSYVMKAGRDNRLVKQYLELGTPIYSGSYVEIISGLTAEDYIAFPYGADVKEGVRTLLDGTEDPPFPEEGAESSAAESGLEDGTASGGAGISVGTMDGAVYY